MAQVKKRALKARFLLETRYAQPSLRVIVRNFSCIPRLPPKYGRSLPALSRYFICII